MDEPYIATIYVEGAIQSGNVDTWGFPAGYQHDWTLGKIDELISDEYNQGLILFVDSPGGGVYESDELYLKLKEYKQKTKRPVYAYMGSMAASGGYYISAIADKIIANRNTWTGSIGVTIGTLYDISGFLERYGVKSQTITSGKNKAMGSSVEPMDEEQRAIWQSLVDEAYDQFAQIVAEGRELSIERVKEIADGRIYSAKQALEVDLIDGIGDFHSAVADMQEVYGLHECEIIDVVYEDSSFFSGLLRGMAAATNKGTSEADRILSLVETTDPMPIRYMCQWLQAR